MSGDTLPDWEQVLAAAAHLQQELPDAVLVGGTAAAIYAGHRLSQDADHVLVDLRDHFEEVLGQLESVAGWKTARVQQPVQILGKLDGIETGIRQLIRTAPLETQQLEVAGQSITLPTPGEVLRIKAALILKRNATRDYLDFIALADYMNDKQAVAALRDLDGLYPQENRESALQQLQIQLAKPLPYDLDEVELAEYKNIVPRWQKWEAVEQACSRFACLLFDDTAEEPEA